MAPVEGEPATLLTVGWLFSPFSLIYYLLFIGRPMITPTNIKFCVRNGALDVPFSYHTPMHHESP